MSYTYVGAGSNSNSGIYRITLRLYRDCESTGAQLDQTAAITVYQNGIAGIYRDLQVPIGTTDVLQLSSPGPCIDNAPNVCYQIGTYTTDIELPFSGGGYTVAYQRCCRIENITNINNSVNAGATYMAVIPGTATGGASPKNSSPIFRGRDTVLICEDNPFIYDFSATDAEGDSLVYTYEDAYNFQQSGSPQPSTAQPPPYESVSYRFGFSALRPMGSGVILNPFTGIMSGTAPASGIYVVTVAVLEYRGGLLINRHRKDLHIKVAPCSIAAADLDPEYINCDGLVLTFQNKNSSPLIRNYFWDFGVDGIKTDTANIARPTFTYPDTGVYKVMLITNRGEECTDTAYTLARVFPKFSAGFTVLESCKNIPFQFTDTSKATFGTVNSWRWSFGNPLINPDIATTASPTYAYPTSGSYQVQLIVASSKGCRDTVEKTINVLDKPVIQRTNDTVICARDTLQLQALGVGTVKWTPSTGLSNPDIPNPLAYPLVPTKYYVSIISAPGCEAADSVFVDVKQFVTLDAGNDTTICLTDTVRLTLRSDGLRFQWQPAATLDDPSIKTPLATPTQTTLYQVTASIGSCVSSDGVRVTTVPYPTVTISPDVAICYDDTIRLTASGGNAYRWSPSVGLSNNQIPDPLAFPLQSTTYRVAVRDNKGCPKASFDTVRVTVLPAVRAFAGNDTTIVVGQPLQLQASGGDYYEWTPPTGLSDANTPDPTSVLDDDMIYLLKVTTDAGCFAYDTLRIRVFKTEPDIFVPSAFTPNGDRLNDVLTPIPVGVSEIAFFKVYDRWGNLVFSTDQIGKGWDGRIKGKDQPNDTYVWHVRGTAYTGKVIYKKGTVTIIR